jgi:hypothetical protein
MFDTIEIVEGQMCVMGDDGTVHDAIVLTSYREAKSQIQKWTAEFTIDVAEAYTRLAGYFSHR